MEVFIKNNKNCWFFVPCVFTLVLSCGVLDVLKPMISGITVPGKRLLFYAGMYAHE
jgi:hypothetical protein